MNNPFPHKMPGCLLFLSVILFIIIPTTNLFPQDHFGRLKGPNGGEITALAINSDDLIFVGLWGGGIMRSDDDGNSWDTINSGLDDYYISSIAFNSTNTVFAAVYGNGVYRSTDNGGTWTAANNGLTNLNVKVVAVNDSGHVFAGTYGSGVYISKDEGANWENISDGIQYLDISDIAFARNGNLVASTYGDGMYRSTNYGRSWKRSNTNLSNLFVHSMYKNQIGDIYAATNGSGLVLSIDHGLRWVDLGTQAEDLNTTSCIYNTEGDLVVGTRSKGIWWVNSLVIEELIISNISTGGINKFAINSNGVLFAAAPVSGLMKSMDNGKMWQNASSQYLNMIYKLYVKDQSLILASGLGTGISRSTDLGNSWETIDMGGAYIRGLDFSDSAIYVASDVGVLKSTDGGISWNATGLTDPTVRTIAAGWDNHVFATNYDDKPDSSGDMISLMSKSTDGGISWETPAPWPTPSNLPISTLPIEPLAVGRNGHIYSNVYPWQIVHSSDNGTTWDDYFTPDLMIQCIAFTHDDEILAGSTLGLSRSTNHGENWVSDSLGFEAPPFIKSIAVGENRTTYFAIDNNTGLFYSTDNGLTMMDYNDNITLSDFGMIDLTETNDIFFSMKSLFRHVDESNMHIPVQIYPVDNEIGLDIHPQLSWEPSENAELFQLEVSFNPSFSAVIERITQSDTVRKIYAQLKYKTIYYWRVRSKNHSTLSDWSEVWSFTTVIAPPILESPENDSKGVSIDTILIWHPAPDALNYTVQVSDINDFSNMIADVTNQADTSYGITGLNNLATYYWRVKAIGEELNSSWSEEWEFTTILPPPNLIYPPDDSLELYPKVTFIWDTVITSNQYYIQVSKNEDFAPVIYDGKTDTDTSHFFILLEYNTEYFWRIRSGNDDGLSLWSDGWSFLTALLEPVLISPANTIIDVSLSLSLTWENYTGADSYHLQFASDADFNNIIIEEAELTETKYQVDGLDYYTDYYWRVRVNVGDRTSYWSEIWGFKTEMAVTILYEPENDAQNRKLALYLRWYAPKGAKWYHLQVSDEISMNKKIYEADSITFVQKDISGLDLETEYYWRVRAYNAETGSVWSDIWSFTTGDSATSVIDYFVPFSVKAYPNPFNSSINLEYSLTEDALITVKVINLTGETVDMIFVGWQSNGFHNHKWEPKGLPRGTYFYQVMIGNSSIIKKIKLID